MWGRFTEASPRLFLKIADSLPREIFDRAPFTFWELLLLKGAGSQAQVDAATVEFDHDLYDVLIFDRLPFGREVDIDPVLAGDVDLFRDVQHVPGWLFTDVGNILDVDHLRQYAVHYFGDILNACRFGFYFRHHCLLGHKCTS